MKIVNIDERALKKKKKRRIKGDIITRKVEKLNYEKYRGRGKYYMVFSSKIYCNRKRSEKKRRKIIGEYKIEINVMWKRNKRKKGAKKEEENGTKRI